MKRLLFTASIALWVPVLILGTRERRAPAATVVHRVPERPWLSPEATKQIVGEDGRLGPLFDAVTLGGPAPSRETRERIAAFARTNNVEIRFEVADDELRAVRFAVTFGGCCGYEGADAFARRLQRQRNFNYCDCSVVDYYDDWTATAEDGSSARVRVRVNRVEVRWEATASISEVLDRAEQLIGMTKADVIAAAGDRWIELEHGSKYRLEMPFPFGQISFVDRSDMGMIITTDRGRITEVEFATTEPIVELARARWGRPRSSGSTRTWRKRGHVITADGDDNVDIVISEHARPALN